jgi:hypothetical protein
MISSEKLTKGLTYIGDVVSLGPIGQCHVALGSNKLLWTNDIWTCGTWTLTNLKRD